MNLKVFLLHQKEEIEKYKWIESQKKNRDLGEEAITEWIKNNSVNYRKSYEKIYSKFIKIIYERIKDQIPCLKETDIKIILDEITNHWTKELILADEDAKKHLEEF